MLLEQCQPRAFDRTTVASSEAMIFGAEYIDKFSFLSMLKRSASSRPLLGRDPSIGRPFRTSPIAPHGFWQRGIGTKSPFIHMTSLTAGLQPALPFESCDHFGLRAVRFSRETDAATAS